MSDDKKMKLSFNSPASVRRSLSKVANMVLNDEIDIKKANAITYISNGILQSIRTDELEKKVLELEEYINDKQ